ncbi:MAG: site-2 protease family protein [Croceibacterium sp.]
MNATLLSALALIPALVFAIVFHEVAHGWTALLLGDPTAKEQRRLTLNPVRHVDVVGTLLLPGALALAGAPVFGWAKPVPVNKWRLRNPRWGMMLVAAAGPLTNLVLAFIGAVALGLLAGKTGGDPGGVSGFVGSSLYAFILVNVFLALFNLLPIPPFDGSHVVEGLLPRSWIPAWDKLRMIGFPLLFVIIVVLPWVFPGLHIVQWLIEPPATWAEAQYMAIANWVAGA